MVSLQISKRPPARPALSDHLPPKTSQTTAVRSSGECLEDRSYGVDLAVDLHARVKGLEGTLCAAGDFARARHGDVRGHEDPPGDEELHQDHPRAPP